tara:strand:- start:1664 stop:3718 length:2055 start_codon:yes stop_codon:yes gene_type:complete
MEKGLHANNLATAFALIATTAGANLSGGTATLYGASLSVAALILKVNAATLLAAKAIAKDIDAAMSQTHLVRGQDLLLQQMIAAYPPRDADFSAADMNGGKLTEVLIERITDTANDSGHKTPNALAAFRRVMPTVFQNAFNRTTAANTTQTVSLVHITAQLNASAKTDALRKVGITQDAIMGLAQRIAAETEDVGQAWLEMQNAMNIAVQVQAAGNVRSNHGDIVDVVLARVAALARVGKHAAAASEIDDALERAEAQVARLLCSGVAVALLERDTAKAATLLLRKADGDAGGSAAFETLRALRDHHYQIGRDKVSNLDSALAIDVAALVLARAATPDERGTAGNDLGAALVVRGERERGTARLEQAITAYTEALNDRTRDRVPMQWAMTQTNLGTALQSLGERESNTARLAQAIAAYTEALKERTRDRAPLQWAATQMNLGNALQLLGERESNATRLEQAIATYTEALKEPSRDRGPLDWGATQMNLGNALQALGERKNGMARLEQAIAVYTEALKEYKRDRVPMQWAATQMNLGNTLQALGELECDAARLERAVIAYAKALKERTRDHVPMQWAMTQMNLGKALQALGERENGMARLEQAIAAYSEALKEYTRDRGPLDWAMTQGNMAGVELAFFDQSRDQSHLDRAARYMRAAREVFMDAQASQYIDIADRQMALIDARRG